MKSHRFKIPSSCSWCTGNLPTLRSISAKNQTGSLWLHNTSLHKQKASASGKWSQKRGSCIRKKVTDPKFLWRTYFEKNPRLGPYAYSYRRLACTKKQQPVSLPAHPNRQIERCLRQWKYLRHPLLRGKNVSTKEHMCIHQLTKQMFSGPKSQNKLINIKISECLCGRP